MRRQRGEGSVFRRADGRWAGTVDVGYIGGQRKRKTVYGRTQAEVVKKIGQLNRQKDDRGSLPTADWTVARWLDYWLTDIAARRVKPATLAGYRTAVNQYLKPTFGSVRLPRLAPQHVLALHRAMADKGLSTTTAMNAHRILSAALTDAARWNHVPRNVATLVKAPSAAPSKREGLTLDQAVKVLTCAAGDRLGSTWLIALMLGLRQGERLGLRWSHVDLEAGTIDVAWSLQRADTIRPDLEHVPIEGRLYLLRPKTRTSTRLIPLPRPILDALRTRHTAVVAERPSYVVDHDLVWCRPDGGPVPPRADWQAWRDLLTDAGVEPHSLHEARNTAATLLFEGGADAGVIKAILGHSTVAMSRSYQRVSLELARLALDDVGSRLALTP